MFKSIKVIILATAVKLAWNCFVNWSILDEFVVLNNNLILAVTIAIFVSYTQDLKYFGSCDCPGHIL
jgi:hypothetical protein